MSVPRLFYCTVTGLVVATLASFLFGASGVRNYRQLQVYEQSIVASIAVLEQTNGHLERRLQTLRTDPEVMRLLARETGYYRPDELVIRVGSESAEPTTPAGARRVGDFAAVGPLVQHGLAAPRDPFNVLALGLFLGAGLFAAMTVRTALRSRTQQALAGAGQMLPAVARPSPDEPFSTIDETSPATGAPDSAVGISEEHPAAGGHEADDEAAAEPAPRRRRPRSRWRRREQVTVYRL